MRVILTDEVFEKFDTKKLYKQILHIFDEYNLNKIATLFIVEKSSMQNLELHEESLQKKCSNPTLDFVLQREKHLKFVEEFEEKMKYLKDNFTEEESIIFHYALEEREADKCIITRIKKCEHTYYQLKKSCYLKIALSFGLIKLKQ